MRAAGRCACIALACLALAPAAGAGPPYVTDDPEPTEFHHFEIYGFGEGTKANAGKSGAGGIDFNYGAAPDLQLTAVAPIAFEEPARGKGASGVGNVELAVKYRILHQNTFGWDVSVFPRVFLPSPSRDVGERRAALLLPVWIGRSWGKWSTFGGGGCTIHRGGDAQDFCTIGWALTRDVTGKLHVGFEIYHQSPDAKDAKASTAVGAGVVYDLNDHYHLMASAGPGLQNTADADRNSWYTALLFTF